MFVMTGHLLLADNYSDFDSPKPKVDRIGERIAIKVLQLPFSSCTWENGINVYNSAEITVPGYMRSGSKSYENIPSNVVLAQGKAIKLLCGYDGNIITRFCGHIVETNGKNGKLVVKCEGLSYQLRRKSFTTAYNNPTVRKMLQDAVEGTDIKLSESIPDINLTGSVPTQQWSRAIDVIDYLKEKCGLSFYFNHNILYVGLKYIPTGKDVKFRIGWNTVNADSLVYKDQTKPFSISLSASKKEGGKTLITKGQGAEIKITIDKIKDVRVLHDIATDKWLDHNPGNYSGSIEVFAEPFIQPFDAAIINDTKFPERKGKYFVDIVKGSFSERGGRQHVGISIKLN